MILAFASAFTGVQAQAPTPAAPAAARAELIAPGIWKIRLGAPEKFTPVTLREDPVADAGLKALAAVEKPPFDLNKITFKVGPRGCVAVLPLAKGENLFGFGLNFKVLNATSPTPLRRTLKVTDAQVTNDLGDSHAPVPFYASTAGYGVFADTARDAVFYCGNLTEKRAAPKPKGPGEPMTDTATMYTQGNEPVKDMTIEIPVAQGVDLYVFGGPEMKTAVQRYNLFSGGGVLPPLWGLGVWYRGYAKYSAAEILEMGKSIRDSKIPLDVYGLEPGWQSQSYSSSFVWSPERWPDPAAFGKQMTGLGYHLNLWEHCFTHPNSPLFGPLRPYSGDYLVWDGLVPDFATKEARQIFADYHEREIIKKGSASGFKLDECDDQPQMTKPWSFPEFATFPSGLDGEQYHHMIGLLYQRTLADIFKKNGLRTYGQVRTSGALAAPAPFVVYSDWYDHRDYVRAIVNSGFSGLLWQPEVRDADTLDEFYRRLQTAVFSPQTLVNAWYIKLPPWKQINRAANNNGTLMEGWQQVEADVRRLFELRMSLVPYLYSAFAAYHAQGVPPLRALVMDTPADRQTYQIDDEYMMGDSLLVAPLFASAPAGGARGGRGGRGGPGAAAPGLNSRRVYLPAGEWFDFWTHQKYEGGRNIQVTEPRERIPVFVKGGTLLPLARPVQNITADTRFEITVTAFGKACRPCTLVEDDGVTTDFDKGKQNVLTLAWPAPARGEKGSVSKSGTWPGSRYTIVGWQVAGE